MSPPYRLLGTPRFGGILVVADHASNHVPADIHLGIDPALLDTHIAVDLGVAEVAERMSQRPGTAAVCATVSRLVCDFNREANAPGLIPQESDGHAIPGNALSNAARAARIAHFYDPYHTALAELLDAVPPALILSLHSFTPQLSTRPEEQRPWQVGVLYKNCTAPARAAIALLEGEGLSVGDQKPYSGLTLNASMDRHGEAESRPYLGIEVRQDEIATAAGQGAWADRLTRICNRIALTIS